MNIYSFTITPEQFEKTNRSLSKLFEVEYQHIEYEPVTFYSTQIGRGGATKGTTGYKYTQEQKQNISDSLKGKLGNRLGKTVSEETKRKISQSKMSVKLSKETKEKMKLDGRKGRKHTEETRQKMKELALEREKQKRLFKL